MVCSSLWLSFFTSFVWNVLWAAGIQLFFLALSILDEQELHYEARSICSKGPIRSKLRGYSTRLWAICGWLSCSIWWLNRCSLLSSYWICHEEQHIQKSFLCWKDIQITLIFPGICHGSVFLQGKGQSFVSWAYSERAPVVQNDLAENEKQEKQMKQTIEESWQSAEVMKTSRTCPLPHSQYSVSFRTLLTSASDSFWRNFKLAPFPAPQWGGHHPVAKATDLNVWLHRSYHRLWLVCFNLNFCIVH